MWDPLPQPRIKPGPPALGPQSPSCWTNRKSQGVLLKASADEFIYPSKNFLNVIMNWWIFTDSLCDFSDYSIHCSHCLFVWYWVVWVIRRFSAFLISQALMHIRTVFKNGVNPEIFNFFSVMVDTLGVRGIKTWFLWAKNLLPLIKWWNFLV